MKKMITVLAVLGCLFSGLTLRAQQRTDIYMNEFQSITRQLDGTGSGQTILVKAKVGNAGTIKSKPAQAEFRVIALHGPTGVRYVRRLPPVALPALSAGKDTVINFRFTDREKFFNPDSFRVQLFLDMDNVNQESSQTNNIMAFEKMPPETPITTSGITQAQTANSPMAIPPAGIKSITAFSCSFIKNGIITLTNSEAKFETPTIYNHDKSNISIDGTTITVKKSGIYHFDFFLNTLSTFKQQPYPLPTIRVSLKVKAQAREYILMDELLEERIDAPTVTKSYYQSEKEALDLYLPAGAVLSIHVVLGLKNVPMEQNLVQTHFYDGYLNGYLVQGF